PQLRIPPRRQNDPLDVRRDRRAHAARSPCRRDALVTLCKARGRIDRPYALYWPYSQPHQHSRYPMTTRLKSLGDWVAEVAELTQADQVHWCDGSEQEYRSLSE